jgi:hypothetical protein
MDNTPKVIASWEGKEGAFRVVGRRSSGCEASFVIEKRHKDALGEASWRAHTTFDDDDAFRTLFVGLNDGKYELVKKR